MRYFVLYTLPYLTLLVFVLGCGYRLAMWLRAPAPLKIPLTPAPKTRMGIAGRYLTEMLIFRTLFSADKRLWAASWVFHAALAFVVGGHVVGIFFSDFVCRWRGWTPGEYERFSAVSGGVLGLVILLPLLYLFTRRLREERVRYISGAGDYLALLLFLGIVLTGDWLRFVSDVQLVDVHEYAKGLITLQWRPAPRGQAFVWHFFLVNVLLMYAPFGKIVHAGGIFFSPTRYQRNNPRDQRHVNAWNDAPAAPKLGLDQHD